MTFKPTAGKKNKKKEGEKVILS